MKRKIGISAIGAAIITSLYAYISGDVTVQDCEEITIENVGEFVDASEWIDPQVKRVFRELENVDIIVVFHHTATSEKLLASDICRITNNRFNLGCSYAATIHENGKVIMLNTPDEHTPSVGGMNSVVLSFSFVGNYQDKELPDIMLKRACQIRAALTAVADSRNDFNIKCFSLHRNWRPTLCPGDKASEQLLELGIVDNITDKP